MSKSKTSSNSKTAPTNDRKTFPIANTAMNRTKGVKEKRKEKGEEALLQQKLKMKNLHKKSRK